MDKKQEYSSIDLHHHSKYSYEAPKATLPVKEILEYYRQLAETKNERVIEDGKEKLLPKRVAFSICDHDSSEGAYYAWKYINENPQKYKGFDFIPGIELGVNCHRALVYSDPSHRDDKYVFKHMHILAHAKPGKEKEFFKKTFAISILNKMVIDPDKNNVYDKSVIALEKQQKQNKYISIGGQILAGRNMLFDKYSVKIPFDKYLSCVKDGASYEEIRNIFLEVSFKYIVSHTNAFNKKTKGEALQEISRAISYKQNINNSRPIPIFPKKPQIIQDLVSLNKIDILELNEILGDSATICFAHPHTLGIHNKTNIAVKDFKDVDISILPPEVQEKINNKLNNPNEFANGWFSTNDIMDTTGKYKIKGDWLGLVCFQIFYNKLLEKGVKIDGFEMTRTYDRKDKMEKVLDVVMDKYNLAVSYGTDDHFNSEDKYYFEDLKNRPESVKKESYFSSHNMFATESSYFKLNRSGKEKLKPEENEVTFMFTK